MQNIKIISGGQTGVDRAALDFALQNKIPCGGWCPQGRKAEDGTISSKYALKETDSEDYESRTIRNVQDSDGTLIIINKYTDSGTFLTISTAKKLNKAIFIQNISTKKEPEIFRKWVYDNNIKMLNIAGPRESNSSGIYEQALKVLGELLDKI